MSNNFDQIKQLRSETGLSITKCQEALKASDGDIEKAREVLRQGGADVATKKSHRTLGSGVIQSYIHSTKTTGSMVEMFCETDFVARNEEFITLAHDIALHIAACRPHHVSRNEISEESLQKITTRIQEASKDGTPADVEKKVDEYLREITLLEQSFVKDEKQTIQDLIESAIHKFGERIEIGRFTVWEI